MSMRRFPTPTHSFVACAALWIAIAAGSLTPPVLGQAVGLKQGEPCPSGFFCIAKGAELAVPLCPAGNIAYSVTVENQTTLPGGAEIFDTIPAGTTYVPGSASNGGGYDAANDRIVWEGPLPPGQSWTIGFSVTVDQGAPSPSTITNVATGVLFGGETPLQAQTGPLDVQVNCPPLAVAAEKTALFAEPLECPGGNVLWEVRFKNLSDRPRDLTAAVDDPVPAGMTFVGDLPEDCTYNATTRRITCNGISIAPGETKSIGFSTTVDAGAGPGDTFTNTATVTLSDPVEEDSVQKQASETISCPTGRIRLRKRSFPDAPLSSGSRIRYTIELTNPAENDHALEASIKDPIPADTSFVAGSLVGGAAYDPDPPEAVVWQGTLAPGESKLIGFSVEVNAGVPDGTVITNTGEGVLTDPDTHEELHAEARTDDKVPQVGQPPPKPPLEIDFDKTSTPDIPLCPGSTIDYQVVLTNPAANGRPLQALILDLFPQGTAFVPGSVSAQCTNPTRPCTFLPNFGILQAGQSVILTFSLKAKAAAGTRLVNHAWGFLFDPLTDELVGKEDETEDVVDDCDGGGCRLEVSGFAEDSIGNGQGTRYPVSNSRIWLFDIGSDALPIAPLSEQVYAPMKEGRTNRTFETDLRNEKFPLPGRARYDVDFTGVAGVSCPPRTVVVSALWDADDRFAVAPRNSIGGRYVPAYLARCISDEPAEILPAGPCYAWKLQGATFVPWNPMKDQRAEIGFTYGSSPTNEESTRVIRDPATSSPPLSESWDFGPGLPPDFFFQDAAHMDFFSYKAMESLDGLAEEVREALGDIAEADGQEPEDLILSPVLVTPHDRDCPSGCTWSTPQLQDDPLRALPGRLPLTFGALADGGTAVSAGSLVAFDASHSSSRFPEAPFPDTGDKPDNREWHELGHWWMLQLYGGDWPGGYRNDTADCLEEPPVVPPVPSGFGNGNHCGYANRTTTDSYIEGFAEMTSMLIADHYADPQPFLYHFRGSGRNLEVDHQVWGPYRAVRNDGEATALELFDPRDEDFAVAGILWDLFDQGSTTEPKARGVASEEAATEDRSEEAPAEIFAHIRHDRPEDLASLFGALSSAFPEDRDDDGLGDVEEIFAAHGAFGDDLRDLRHNPGEILGDTGSSKLPDRPLRLLREPVPNGYLDFGITAEGGFPLAPYGFPLHLRYELDPPFDDYDYEQTVRSRGRLYLNLPPPLYEPCRLTITVRGRGATADLGSDPLVITCAEYWNAIEAGEPSLGSHTFVLESETPPEPPAGPWLTSPDLPGFEAKVRITPAGGEPVAGAAEPSCIVESLCVSGALPGRPEVFVKVIGPRPNGKLWTQISRFTPSEVEVWLKQQGTGIIRYYRLASVGSSSDDVSGLQDREAFDPTGAPSSAPRGVLLPGAAVDLLPASSILAPRLDPGEPEPPEEIDWLDTPGLPGFRFKARITPAGGQAIGGGGVERCIPETLCIAGALEGRPEVFAKIIGPRPNGFLWVQAARFTPSQVELWIEETGTGTVRYYRLEPVGRDSDDVSGLQDRQAFAP